MAITVDELVVADPPQAWSTAGFTVTDGTCRVGDVGIRLVGRERGIGIIGWALRGLDARDIEALYDSLRRVLPLMDGRVDVLALTNDLLQWGEQVKKRWAYAYEWPARTSS